MGKKRKIKITPLPFWLSKEKSKIKGKIKLTN
jgi:hypothetical protein